MGIADMDESLGIGSGSDVDGSLQQQYVQGLCGSKQYNTNVCFPL